MHVAGVRFTPTCVGKTPSTFSPPLSYPVHPHVCGEDDLGTASVPVRDGSPPRVWGRPLVAEGPEAQLRFTPTCVGKTRRCKAASPSSPVHPHVCGEDAVADPDGDGHAGSPPRVWGRQAVLVRRPAAVRFTPTCVGKTVWKHCPVPSRSVHPHVCGEDASVASSLAAPYGSPPRVWGRLLRYVDVRPAVRFTPTCVGKTPPSREHATLMPVHPHVCGEDGATREQAIANFGSPPRVWGRRDLSSLRSLRSRFTPTCVGKTWAWFSGFGFVKVHPHVCGEDSTLKRVQASENGSPPRVWGRRERKGHRGLSGRFTPTCVGKTRGSVGRWGHRSVHPHVCGEDVRNGMNCSHPFGSPPRVWGRRISR